METLIKCNFLELLKLKKDCDLKRKELESQLKTIIEKARSLEKIITLNEEEKKIGLF